jgi:peptide/nickel transport system substrate-binding protein
MHVTFTLQPFVWSDGTAVTAEDSVFSYQIAAAPATPMPKTRVQRTASYQATGPHTVEWIGVPGNITDDYVQNIWTPLPKHQLGQYSAAELLTLDLTTRMPLSYGRFVIEAWEPGSHISLISNPYYYALDKNAPIQRIVYEFLEPEADF